MPKPWEKYGGQQKPWEKYSAQPASLDDSLPVPGPASGTSTIPTVSWLDDLKRTGSAFLDPLIGAGELGAAGITNIGGKIIGGTSGIIQGAGDTLLTNPYNYFAGKPLVNPFDSAADRSRSIEDALTYQPGARGREVGGALAQAAKDVYGKTGLPTLTPDTPLGQTLAPAVGDAAASLTALPKVGSGVLRAADAATIPKPKPFVEAIPTTAELRKAKTAAYKQGENSGAIVSANDFAKAADEIAAEAKSNAVDPVLHPKTSRLVQVMQERKGKDLTLQEAENIRRIALEAEGDVNQIGKQSADGMRAGQIVDALDDKIDALSINDEARALNRRMMNSQMLDTMIERATNNAGAHYTQAGMEHALRQQFKQLANNPQRMRRFSQAQQDAIRKVVRGGPLENTLRALGKFDPTAGAVPFIAGSATGGTMMLPGFLARRGATRMTANNVEAAREALVGRGLPSAPIQAPAAAAPLSGELVARPPLALPAPTIISGPRSAPGSMYAREQIGLTPDVELAGMQHPGMARQSVPPQRPALPYIPSEPSPMIVDQAGRVSPTAQALEDYLQQTGQNGLGNVRQPRAEPTPEPQRIVAEALTNRGKRTTKTVLEDLRRVEGRIRALTPEEYQDGVTVQALSDQWSRLQAELKQRESRGASLPQGGAP